MKIQIVGNGAFGSFLRELLTPHFQIVDEADTVILAVPLSAYEEVAAEHKGKHLVNVCSIQKPSTEICLKYSERVTGIHPLFGRRTPSDKRHAIATYEFMKHKIDNDTWEQGDTIETEFLRRFSNVCIIVYAHPYAKGYFTPESHDILMAKTHLAAAIGAQQLKVLVDRAKDVPDMLVPNSFRLMREFVKTLEDMPPGTIESILANTY